MAKTVVKMLGYLSHSKSRDPIHKAKEHIKYIEVNREKHRNNPDLFNAREDNVNRKDFFRSIERMPQQGVVLHKLVISLKEDDRDNLQIDLREMARDTMERFQLSQGKQFEWVAAIHDDEGHPHVHIAIKGRDSEGKQIFFAPTHVKDLKRIAHQEKILQAERNPNVSREKILQSERETRKEMEREQPKFIAPNQRATMFINQIESLVKKHKRQYEYEQEQEEYEINRNNRGLSR